MRLSRHRKTEWCALAAGALSALGFAPLGWWWVWTACTAWLLLTLLHTPGKRQLVLSALFGLGAAMATTHWLGPALWNAPGMPKGVSAGACLVAWAYAAWPWMLPGAVGATADRWFPMLRAHARLGAMCTALAAGWWTQAWWFDGFPWAVPATVWLDSPLQGWGAVGGGLLMATLGLLLAASTAMTCRAIRLHRRVSVSYRHHGKWQTVGMTACIWTGVLGGGQALQGVGWTQAVGDAVRVGVVQPDRPESAASNAFQDHAYQRMAWRMTDALISRHKVEVVIWPESMVTGTEAALRDWVAQQSNVLQGRSLLLGATIHVPSPPGNAGLARAHNSLLAVGAGAHGRYDKRELVPLTERWPASGPWPLLGAWAHTQPWLLPGAKDQPPLMLAGTRVGASICYEDAFPQTFAGLPADTGWLVNASNDQWFAGSVVMPDQHLALSRLRALEQQKPLVRAANVGPSAIVDAWGQARAQTTPGKPQLLHSSIQPREGLTPYARHGHGWLGWLALACMGVVLLEVHRLRPRRRRPAATRAFAPPAVPVHPKLAWRGTRQNSMKFPGSPLV